MMHQQYEEQTEKKLDHTFHISHITYHILRFFDC